MTNVCSTEMQLFYFRLQEYIQGVSPKCSYLTISFSWNDTKNSLYSIWKVSKDEFTAKNSYFSSKVIFFKSFQDRRFFFTYKYIFLSFAICGDSKIRLEMYNNMTLKWNLFPKIKVKYEIYIHWDRTLHLLQRQKIWKIE